MSSIDLVARRVQNLVNRYNAIKGNLMSMNQLMVDLENEIIGLDAELAKLNTKLNTKLNED